MNVLLTIEWIMK